MQSKLLRHLEHEMQLIQNEVGLILVASFSGGTSWILVVSSLIAFYASNAGDLQPIAGCCTLRTLVDQEFSWQLLDLRDPFRVLSNTYTCTSE